MATVNETVRGSRSHRDCIGTQTLRRGAARPPSPLANRAAILLILEEAGSPLMGVTPDAALSHLLRQTVDDLLLPGNEARLDSILRYHAIARQVRARHDARAARRCTP